MFRFVILLMWILILIVENGGGVEISGDNYDHDQMCLAAQGLGLWIEAKFVSTVIPKYIDFPAIHNNEQKLGRSIPRVLFIGDSINRNAIHSICEACKLHPSNIYNCTAPIGGGFHYLCHTNAFEIASFFIFGASLNEVNRESSWKRKDHSCYLEHGQMPFGTLDRVKNYTHVVKSSFSGKIDLIVLNAMLWNIGDIQSAGKSKIFDNGDFNEF
jgi:hypothetical protein